MNHPTEQEEVELSAIPGSSGQHTISKRKTKVTKTEKAEEIVGNSKVAAKYVLKSTSRDKKGFIIGLITVLLLVTYICLLQNVIRKSPIIFLKLSENSVGEFDMVISSSSLDTSNPFSSFTTNPNASWFAPNSTVSDSSSSSSGTSNSSTSGIENLLSSLFSNLISGGSGMSVGSFFVNWTDIQEKLFNDSSIVGSTPRWMMLASLSPIYPNNSQNSHSESHLKTLSSDSNPEISMAQEDSASAVLLIINSTNEELIGLGRSWKLPKLNNSQCYASKALLSRIGENKNGGGFVEVKVDFFSIAASLLSGLSATTSVDYSKEQLIATLLSNLLGIPESQYFNYSFQLPDNLVGLLNASVSEIVITLPSGFNASREAAKELYDNVRDALDTLGIWMQPFENTALANMTDFTSGTIVIDIPDFLQGLGNIDISPNGTVTFSIGYDISIAFNSTLNAIADALILRENYTVAAGISDPDGKFSSALGNVVILEADSLNGIFSGVVENLMKPIRSLAASAFGIVSNTQSALGNLNQTIFNIPQIKQLINQIETFKQQLSDIANSTSTPFNISIGDYAMTVILKKADREKMYMLSSDDIDQALIDFSNEVSERLGFNSSYSYTTPIATALSGYSFFRLFIDQIFLFTLIVMLFLGACLVFSLLLSDVEAKTFEYGMLRALGMKQYVLVELLSFQSLLFSLPGIGFGVLLGWLVYIPVAWFIGDYVQLPMDLTTDSIAITLSVVLGFLMPAVSNVIPIQRALSNTLRDALDIYHQVTSEIKVKVMKLESLGLSPLVLSLSILVVIFGFATYYLIPLSFIFSNFSLFFTILILILICFLFGLVLISVTFQPFLEIAFLYVIIWGKSAIAIRSIVKKNLSGHSRRNSKTALMLTTGIAFILFAGASFSLMGGSLQNLVRMTAGSDFAVYAPIISSPLDEDNFRKFLSNEIASGTSIVKSFSFVTFPLSSFSFVYSTQIANLAGYPRTTIDISGVDKNYVTSSFETFYTITEKADQFTYNKTTFGKDDVIQSLYDNSDQQLLSLEEKGLQIPKCVLSNATTTLNDNTIKSYTSYVDVVVSEALRLGGCIDTDTPLLLRVRYRVANSTDISSLRFLAKARAMSSSMAGFFFSPYQSLAYGSPVLVTMDKFYKLLNTTYTASQSTETLRHKPQKMMLIIKTIDSTTPDQREALSNSLHTYISDDLTQVFDTQGLIDTTSNSIEMMNLFFLVVSIVAICLCFFVLWLSFTANVNENSWEFAVLRSVGLTANQTISLYVYEALSIVLSSFILGTIIGLAVAIVLTVQFNMFTQLPFTFNFPYTLFFPTLGLSVLIAIIGSYLPATIIRYKPISSVLKGL